MIWVMGAIVLLLILTQAGSSTKGTGLSSMSNVSSAVQTIAQGIATAEGYYDGPGVIPYDNNNPGDIKVNGVIATYPDIQTGWNALYNQIQLMLDGRSSVYNPNMSISQVGQLWTGGDNATGWSDTVAGVIGVTPDTQLNQVS